MQFKEKTVKEQTLFSGKILNLRRDEVMLPNGKGAVREVVEHSGGSAILCIKDGKVLLVKQFRYAFNEELYEIPAGKLNAGESPDETAIRELEEEGGIKAEKVAKLFDVYASPGYTNEIIRIYKAEGLSKAKQHLDDDEFLSCSWISLDTAKEMINSGEIKDAKTIIALLYALNNY